MALLTDAEWTDYINSLLRYDAQASVAAKLGTILGERTRLLQEVLNGNYMHHWGTCYRSMRGYSNTKPEDCDCGAHALMAEIREAVKAQP